MTRLRTVFLVIGWMCLLQSCSSDETETPPECAPSDCSDIGKNCGSVMVDSTTCRFCGRCSSPQTCGGGGTPNVCGCTPKTACVPGDCGATSDGCGGTLNCPDNCEAPQTCGGSGLPGRCGVFVGEGEVCNNDSLGCTEGFDCCETSSGNLQCQAPIDGSCPNLLPDLALSESVLRSSLRVEVESLHSHNQCANRGECELTPSTLTLLTFETEVSNVGLVNFDWPTIQRVPRLYEAGMCTEERKPLLLHYRVRNAATQLQVAQGKLVTRCFEDTAPIDGTLTATASYSCPSNPGLTTGWTYRTREELGADCQTVDITFLERGDYVFELEINADHLISESRFDNNVVTATITR